MSPGFTLFFDNFYLYIVESIIEEQKRETENRKRRRTKQKKVSNVPRTWNTYIENKKQDEAQERKLSRNLFLHVVEGNSDKSYVKHTL